MTDGTPLRKFGHYRVRQLKRRTPFFVLVDERDGADIVMSYCKGVVEYVGERLGAGRMVATPREHEAAWVEVSGDYYPTRHWFVNSHWLGGGIGDRWINGGPVPTHGCDVYSAAGRASMRNRNLELRTAEIAHAIHARECIEQMYAKQDAEVDRVRALYDAGKWPDVEFLDESPEERASSLRTYRLLHDVHDGRCPLHDLLAVDAAPVWVDAGRDAMRLLLRYGEDDKTPMRATLREWATQLAARHGGDWTGT